MKRLVTLSLCVVLVSTIEMAFAQEDSPTSYSSFFTLAGSRYEPAILGDDPDKIHIQFINLYGWAGNNTFTIADIEKMKGSSLLDFNSERQPPSQSEFDDLFSKLKDVNRLGFGATVDPLNVSFRIDKSGGDETDSELLTIFAGIGERMEFNLKYPNELFRLAWLGNKQFAGERVEFPFSVNALWTREYTVAAAAPIPIELHEDIELRGGLRLKYIQGLYAFFTERSQAGLFTDTDGKYLELDYDYLFHSSLDLSDSTDDAASGLDPFNGPGAGFAFDVGISTHYKERWYANINFLDIGGLTFKGENNYTYENQGSFLYEGVGVDNPLNDTRRQIDSSFQEIWEGASETTGNDFRVPYPQRMRFHASYKIPAKDKHGHTYHKHAVGLTLIQGFKDIGNATKSTYLAGAYTFNLLSHFEVGTNVGLRGYNIVEMGFFAAVKAGFFRLGIGSGNIIGPLMKNVATGGDFNFNMTFAF